MLTEILFPNSQLEFDSAWVNLADWYDQSNMSDLIYFDSLESIDEVILNSDFQEVSARMYRQNEIREDRILKQWENLLKGIS
jgi:hypothetical protein